MEWEGERFVKVYTRDTSNWLRLSIEAQSVKLLLARKIDRAGRLELGGQLDTIALVLGHLSKWETFVKPALEELIERGTVVIEGEGRDLSLFMPGFADSQTARANDKSRSEAKRERKSAEARSQQSLGLGDDAPVPSPDVTRSPLLRLLWKKYPEEAGKWTPEWEELQRAAYPGVDLLKQAQRAIAWEANNAGRAKKDHARFLGNWWEEQQERAGTRGRRGGGGFMADNDGGSARVPSAEKTQERIRELRETPRAAPEAVRQALAIASKAIKPMPGADS
jgi:hypothetical protein